MRDSGVGISDERLPRIFDLFSQSDPSPDRAHGGLGVGLTLARRLVDMHAGELTVSSAGPGRGSEFRTVLPALTTAPMRQAASPLQPAGSATKPPTALRVLRVLIVDDHVDATRALRRLLLVMGHEVTIAHDGQSGIEMASRDRPDVILLDIGLPQMDGYAVARHLRSLPHFGTTRIIALTGYGAEEARQNVRRAGFDEHLIKPVDADELEAALFADQSRWPVA